MTYDWTYGTSLEELTLLPEGTRWALDATPAIRKSVGFVVVDPATYEDMQVLGSMWEAWIRESARLAELARRGFLGRVRCARCRRRLRCVYAEVDGRHYGLDCYLATFGEALA